MGTTTEVEQVDTDHLAPDLTAANRGNPVKWNWDLIVNKQTTNKID